MPQPPCLSAQFTLLYGDPGSAAERQYLQPLYGLTLPPQYQPIVVSNTNHGDTNTGAGSPLSPATTAVAGSPTATSAASSPVGNPPSSNLAAGVARRTHVDLANMGLFPELPPEGMGPQPIFGGCFLGPEPDATVVADKRNRTGEKRKKTEKPTITHFRPDGTPSLHSIIQDDYQSKNLSQVRKKFPCPSARSGHVFLSCREKKAIILHGGLEDISYNDTWMYDVVTSRWREMHCTARKKGWRSKATPTSIATDNNGGNNNNNNNNNNEGVANPEGGGRERRTGLDSTGHDTHQGHHHHHLGNLTGAAESQSGVAAEDDEDGEGVMPPCAFGQAGALFHCYDIDYAASAAPTPTKQQQSKSGKSRRAASSLCMFITGGILENDECNDKSFALNLDTQEWSVLPLTTELPDMWGSIAETVRVRRRRGGGGGSGSGNARHSSSSLARCASGQNSNNNNSSKAKYSGNATHNENSKSRSPHRCCEDAAQEEMEEVIVVFGGMNGSGKPVSETFLIHLERKLTEQEVFADPDFYLECIGYDETARIQSFLERQKEKQESAALDIFSAGTNQSNNSNNTANTNTRHQNEDGTANSSTPSSGATTGATAAAAAAGQSAGGGGGLSASAAAALETLFGAGGNGGGGNGTATTNNRSGSGNNNNNSGSNATADEAGAAKVNRPVVTAAEINAFRMTHRDLLDDWRQEELKSRLVGRYLVEVLPPTPGLPGRRRASSSVYKKCFVFLFGGRDDYGYYNDFWVFNAEVRRWVQIRDEVPIFWLRQFFTQPQNETAALAVANINEQIRQVRSDPERNEKNNPNFTEQNKLKFNMFLKQYVHDNLYSCTSNSTAKARTGSVMFADESKHCIYVFGGFTLSKGQLWTFCDVHVYFIDFHCWRRVPILPSRAFDLRCTEDPQITEASPVIVDNSNSNNNNNTNTITGNDNADNSSNNTTGDLAQPHDRESQRGDTQPSILPNSSGFRPVVGVIGDNNGCRNTHNGAQWDATEAGAAAAKEENRKLLRRLRHDLFLEQQQRQLRPEIVRRVSPMLDATLLQNADNARLALHSAMYESGNGGDTSPLHPSSHPLSGTNANAASGSVGIGSREQSFTHGSAGMSGVLSGVAAAAGCGNAAAALRIRDVAPTVCSYNADAQSLVGMTVMRYASTYLKAEGTPEGPTGKEGARAVAEAYPPKPIAPRYSRYELLGAATPGEAMVHASAEESGGNHANGMRCFQLPIMAPEARTMAAVAADPLNYFRGGSDSDEDEEESESGLDGNPERKAKKSCQQGKGSKGRYANGEVRFFLHGGRAGEDPRGDLLEIRVKSVSKVDFEYHQTTNLLNRWVLEQEQTNIHQRRQRALALQRQQLQHANHTSNNNNDSSFTSPAIASQSTTFSETSPAGPPSAGPTLPNNNNNNLPPMNTLNSPSNPNLNPMHPPAVVPLSGDRRLSHPFLADLHARCSTVARQRLLHELEKREEEDEAFLLRTNPDSSTEEKERGGGEDGEEVVPTHTPASAPASSVPSGHRQRHHRHQANPYVPHGRYDDGDATDAYGMLGTEKRRPHSLYLSTFAFLRQLVDFPIRHRGDTLTSRDFRRNVEIISPEEWVADTSLFNSNSNSNNSGRNPNTKEKEAIEPAIAQHLDMLRSSEEAVGLIAGCLVTPTAAFVVGRNTQANPSSAAAHHPSASTNPLTGNAGGTHGRSCNSVTGPGTRSSSVSSPGHSRRGSSTGRGGRGSSALLPSGPAPGASYPGGNTNHATSGPAGYIRRGSAAAFSLMRRVSVNGEGTDSNNNMNNDSNRTHLVPLTIPAPAMARTNTEEPTNPDSGNTQGHRRSSGSAAGFPALAAIASTTMESPLVSPSSPALALNAAPDQSSSDAGSATRRGPNSSLGSLPSSHSLRAPPSPLRPVTHSLRHAHIQLYRLFQLEPYYYSGVNYTHLPNRQNLPQTGIIQALNHGNANDFGFMVEPNPQLARTLATSLPSSFLSKLSLKE